MNIPTEPIGSIPRSRRLIEVISASACDDAPELDALGDALVNLRLPRSDPAPRAANGRRNESEAADVSGG